MVNTSNNYIAVQYFFIIAGFFLVYTFDKKLLVINFIKKKIIRLWPLIAFVFCLYLIAYYLGVIKHFDLYGNILSLLFLVNSGISLNKSNIGHDWFISVLFFISIFYFYIYKHFDKKKSSFFISILVLLGYTFFVHATNGSVSGDIKTINNIINLGMLNGLTGMGLGYIIHEFYLYLKEQPYTKSIKSIFTYTILEGLLLGFVIYESGFHKFHFNNKIVLVIAFSFLFITFLLKRGLISKFLDNKISTIIGNYSLSLYITHGFLWNIIHYYWLKSHQEICIAHPYFCILGCFITCLIFAILTYHLVEVPAGKFLKKKFFPQKI